MNCPTFRSAPLARSINLRCHGEWGVRYKYFLHRAHDNPSIIAGSAVACVDSACPPFDPNVYICVCGITSCNLELISTTRAPTGGPTAPCPGRTIGTTPSNSELNCAGKPDGNYVDPFDPCSGGFYMCTNGDPDYFVRNFF